MKKVLVAYFSRTGRTQKMAEYIADGIRLAGNEVEVKKISAIKNAKGLEDFDGYVFGCPTYFKDMTDGMKTFLFMVKESHLEGKIGGAFGSYTHIGSAAELIHETMEHVFRMDMANTGPFNVKEQILDSGKGAEPCADYGKAFGQKLKGG